MITKQVKIMSVVLVAAVALLLVWLCWPSNPLAECQEKASYTPKDSPTTRKFGTSTRSTAATAPTTRAGEPVAVQDESATIKELGVKEGNKIQTGLVLYRGRYVPPPYTVSRRGAAVYINDLCIKQEKWPLPDMTVADDPGDPVGVPEDKTISEIVDSGGANSPISRKLRYIEQHNHREQVLKLEIEFFKRLPCVKDIKNVDSNDGIVTIVYKNGKSEIMQIGPYPGYLPLDRPAQKKLLLYNLDAIRTDVEQSLREGETCIAYGGQGYCSYLTRHSAKKLRTIVDICKSDKTQEEKIDLLWRLELLPINEKEGLKEIVLNFRDSPELQQRVAEQEIATEVTPMLISDIPSEHPVYLLRKEAQRRLSAYKASTMPSSAE